MNKVYLPPEYYTRDGKRLIFLAGPIQGTDEWQTRAAEIIHSLDSNIEIASPRRLDFKPEDYYDQVDWETYHLHAADGVLFWLANETQHLCERAYAQTTRFELGEWTMRYNFMRDFELSIGADSNFTNTRYISHRLSQELPEIKIYTTLEETCEDMVKKLKSSNNPRLYMRP